MIRFLAPVLLVFAIAEPCLASDARLTFDEALRAILQRSTDISSQRAQVSETVATNLPARTAFFPNLAIQLSRVANQDNVFLTRTTSDSLNAVAKLNLFRFGADVKGWQAADEDESSQRLKLADTILKTEGTGVQGLIGEIQGLLETEVESSIVKKQEELLKIGRERYDRGLLPLQEVDKIAVDTENAAAKLADTQIREAQARAQLVALLGHAEIQPGWPWVQVFRELSADGKKRQELLGTEADLQKRPDVRSAQQNLQAQEDRASQRVRQALPTVDSNFTYTSYGLLSGTQTGFTYLNPNWTASVAITIPIFDQLAGYSSARVQYFEEEKASQALEAAQRNAMSDWSSAKSAFELSLGTAIAREKTVQVSRKLYSDSLSRFRLGRIDANDLSQDQSRLSDSELLATAGWAQAHLALAQLCHSRGLEVGECLAQAH